MSEFSFRLFALRFHLKYPLWYRPAFWLLWLLSRSLRGEVFESGGDLNLACSRPLPAVRQGLCLNNRWRRGLRLLGYFGASRELGKAIILLLRFQLTTGLLAAGLRLWALGFVLKDGDYFRMRLTAADGDCCDGKVLILGMYNAVVIL